MSTPVTSDRVTAPPSLQHATVVDAMHRGIVSCAAEASPTAVARLMSTHHVHCVFVMHPGHANPDKPYVWGIISDLDLAGATLRGDENATAGSLAQEPMVSIKPTMRLTEASTMMVKHGVTHLVVVDPATLQPIGVLSTTDVTDILAWGEA